MAERELDRVVRTVATAMAVQLGVPEVRPGKHEVWLTFVRRNGITEELVMPGHRVMVTAQTGPELLNAVARAVVLATFGAEIQVVRDLPNLSVRLLDRREVVHLPGAPPPENPDQIWLKVTVRRYEPGLLARLFGERVEDV